MTFGDAVSSCFSNYANFYGRATRAEFWYWQLFIVLVFGALILVVAFIASAGQRSAAVVLAMLGVLLYLGALLPGLAVRVRRLHDINCSGWLYLIAFVPYLGALILFVMSLIPGTKGTNAYGPDGRPESIAQVF